MPTAPSWDPAGTYTAIFSDDFSSTALDTAKWTPGWFGTGITGPVSSGLPYDSANVTVSNSYLNLNLTAVSGAIVTSNPALVSPGFAFTGGYAEARIYLPPDPSGTQVANSPAFWCDGQNWPVTGQMTILESLSGSAAYHFTSSPGTSAATVGPGYGGWHTFGAHWQPGSSVDYYYDGQPVGSITTGVTSSPMYLVLVSGGGNPADVPAGMLVDWVYVWIAGSAAGRIPGLPPAAASSPFTGITITPSALGQPFGATPAAAGLSFRAAPSVTTSGTALPTTYQVPKQAGTQPGDWILIYVFGGGNPQCTGFSSTLGGVAPPGLAVVTSSLPGRHGQRGLFRDAHCERWHRSRVPVDDTVRVPSRRAVPECLYRGHLRDAYSGHAPASAGNHDGDPGRRHRRDRVLGGARGDGRQRHRVQLVNRERITARGDCPEHGRRHIGHPVRRGHGQFHRERA